MSFELALDPLFRTPLLVGLVFAVLLPALGAWLRLRHEWLAAMGYTHIAAAGALASGLLHWPVLLCAFLAAALAAAFKGMSRRPGNDHYAAMTVAGWALALLIAASSHHGEVLGQTLLRGQLFFASSSELWLAVGVAICSVAAMPWLAPRLLLQRFFPDYFSANGRPNWPHEILFALVVVLALVAATSALGAMAAFALVFLPPWIAFRLCGGWRRCLVMSAALGAAAYLLSFVLAVGLDMPLGPVLALVLLGFVPLRLLGRVL